MDATEMGVLFGGISSILAVLIYFTKNIKESSCCGTKCKQVVVDGHGDIVKTGSFACPTFPEIPKIVADLAPTQREYIV
tara:strand:+ start:129 stop:365 length:237 start_codon:yes stop_codon:yes gene_type:complete